MLHESIKARSSAKGFGPENFENLGEPDVGAVERSYLTKFPSTKSRKFVCPIPWYQSGTQGSRSLMKIHA